VPIVGINLKEITMNLAKARLEIHKMKRGPDEVLGIQRSPKALQPCDCCTRFDYLAGGLCGPCIRYYKPKEMGEIK